MKPRRRKRPRVIVRCPADLYAMDGERIVEFSGMTHEQGGLISLLVIDGKLFVRVYRQGLDVEVTSDRHQCPAKGVTHDA